MNVQHARSLSYGSAVTPHPMLGPMTGGFPPTHPFFAHFLSRQINERHQNGMLQPFSSLLLPTTVPLTQGRSSGDTAPMPANFINNNSTGGPSVARNYDRGLSMLYSVADSTSPKVNSIHKNPSNFKSASPPTSGYPAMSSPRQTGQHQQPGGFPSGSPSFEKYGGINKPFPWNPAVVCHNVSVTSAWNELLKRFRTCHDNSSTVNQSGSWLRTCYENYGLAPSKNIEGPTAVVDSIFPENVKLSEKVKNNNSSSSTSSSNSNSPGHPPPLKRAKLLSNHSDQGTRGEEIGYDAGEICADNNTCPSAGNNMEYKTDDNYFKVDASPSTDRIESTTPTSMASVHNPSAGNQPASSAHICPVCGTSLHADNLEEHLKYEINALQNSLNENCKFFEENRTSDMSGGDSQYNLYKPAPGTSSGLGIKRRHNQVIPSCNSLNRRKIFNKVRSNRQERLNARVGNYLGLPPRNQGAPNKEAESDRSIINNGGSGNKAGLKEGNKSPAVLKLNGHDYLRQGIYQGINMEQEHVPELGVNQCDEEDVENLQKGDMDIQPYQSNNFIGGVGATCNSETNKLRCQICFDQFTNPTTSVQCWHVFCANCWLRSLSVEKMCPQCNVAASPENLRRIFL